MRPASVRRAAVRLTGVVTAAVLGGPGAVDARDVLAQNKAAEARMSPAGQLAAKTRAELDRGAAMASARALAAAADECGEEPECHEKTTRQPGGQAEVSIAVDRTGRNVVIGYNDTRGFSTNPYQLSGYIVSHDGGRTFTPDGLLPTDGQTYVFGDPDVKYLGACDFVYSSIGLVVTTGPAGPVYAQSMVVHRTRDCGDTWEGPFEVPSATNPNGLFVGGDPVDAADKEFMDVDPDTGRVIMSWSNFSSVAPGASRSGSPTPTTSSPPGPRPGLRAGSSPRRTRMGRRPSHASRATARRASTWRGGASPASTAA